MDLLATPRRRKLLFAALYLSEGAPIGFIWWYLPTKLRVAGVPIERITLLTSILVLPWVLKFVWAPLIDVLRGPRWSFRGWIISTQVAMGLALLPLIRLDPASDFRVMAGLLIAHALAASTQDAAVDALAISSSPAGERGSINGWMQAGMLTGRSMFGGVALVVGGRLDERWGVAVVPMALVAVAWLSTILVALSREPPPRERRARTPLLELLTSAARDRNTWLGLLFAAISGAGFEAVGAVAGPYLIDCGFSQTSVGTFIAFPAVGAMLAGSLLGGVLSDRFGRKRMTGLFLVFFVLAVWSIAVLHGTATPMTLVALGSMYLGIGLFVAASYALFMDLTDARLGATQFSTFMAATNGCESWSTFVVGRLIAGPGYAVAFGVMGVLSLAALPVLRAIRR